jgi:hypothetical protein
VPISLREQVSDRRHIERQESIRRSDVPAGTPHREEEEGNWIERFGRERRCRHDLREGVSDGRRVQARRREDGARGLAHRCSIVGDAGAARGTTREQRVHKDPRHIRAPSLDRSAARPNPFHRSAPPRREGDRRTIYGGTMANLVPAGSDVSDVQVYELRQRDRRRFDQSPAALPLLRERRVGDEPRQTAASSAIGPRPPVRSPRRGGARANPARRVNTPQGRAARPARRGRRRSLRIAGLDEGIEPHAASGG